ncbi:MAG: ATP-binding protein [Cyanobacteria bacterium P01_D01_bin.128]
MSAADSNIRDNSLQSGSASSDVHSLSGPIQPVNETAESDSLLSASEMPEANSASIETSETYIQGKEPAHSMAQGVQPELEGAQSFLNIVLNTLSDPVFAKDEQHRWISVNDACCKFLGRDREEILGKTDFDIFPSTEAMQFWQSDDRLLTTGSTLTEEEKLSDAQGTEHIVSTKKFLTYDASGLPMIVGTIQDITSYKQAETVLRQQAERDRLLGSVAQHILQSPEFADLAVAITQEGRQFLKADRMLTARISPRETRILAVDADGGFATVDDLALHLSDLLDQFPDLRQGKAVVIENQTRSPNGPEQKIQLPAAQTTLIVPILQGDICFGVLLAQQIRFERQWLTWEIDTLREVGSQVGSAIQQNNLYQKVQQLNTALEQEVAQRTNQLQIALEFEATLKRITDRVRDNLDEKQILQTAVRELTLALGVKGSNTALYDLDQGTSTIYYEYTASLSPSQGRVSQMEAFPEVYHQLLEGQYFQFCSVKPHPLRGYVAMLACPILDDRGVLGDLWLINDKDYGFNEQDIRLVQQVANQCAIAIRQARLYQAAQSQVEELERLNTLKDDFLSTVSHELRTPVTSMRVALQLLGVTLGQEYDLKTELEKPKAEQHRIVRYYHILQEECEREISLINDLLDLQRLDGGNHPINPTEIRLQDWLSSIVNGFHARIKNRQQQLDLAISPAAVQVVSDSASLERVIAELLNNACKYTPPGGHIVLEVSPQGEDLIKFSIRNTGVEIPASELSRIFEKFYRVPSADPWKQGGTGLGLALVQRLLIHLNSDIQVASGDNQTCFSFNLPRKLMPMA